LLFNIRELLSSLARAAVLCVIYGRCTWHLLFSEIIFDAAEDTMVCVPSIVLKAQSKGGGSLYRSTTQSMPWAILDGEPTLERCLGEYIFLGDLTVLEKLTFLPDLLIFPAMVVIEQ
jgi:hypothetical protein